jgi:DNA segregation ATPase FtsK/SpoIIIE-like protein
MMLEKSDWLIILDQNLKNWDIMLRSSSEKLFYKEDSYRSVGIYSNNCRKFIRGYNELISNIGNFIPREKGVRHVIESVRDINNDGLLSIVSHSSNRIFDSTHGKGNLGLAVAAITYKKQKPDSLLVSMDTQLAREWLSYRDEGLLPDLVGINVSSDTEGLAEIDLIEVKTYRDNLNSFRITEDEHIEGHAVDQVVALENLISEIFGTTEKITTVSRREILREQVFESLFQNEIQSKRKTEFSKQLNDLFAGKTKIYITKQITFVDFENDESSEKEYPGKDKYENEKIKLFIIGRNAIQSIIAPDIQTAEQTTAVNSSTNGNIQDKLLEDRVQPILNKNTLDLTVNKQDEELPNDRDGNLESSTLSVGLEENCAYLYSVLYAFGIKVQKIDPTLVLETARFIRYKVEPKQGQSIRAIQSKSEDIAIQMEANGLVMINHILNTHFVSIDIPHAKPFKSLLLLEKLNELDGKTGYLNVVIGQNAENKIEISDIAGMPHLLVAGTTGSGKTVFLYSVVVSLLYQYAPDEIQFLIIDPKQTDFTFFDELPNLYGGNVVTDSDKALAMINKINNVDKEERTNLLKGARCRDIVSYNQKNPSKMMKRLVVIIDEYADLIATAENNGTKQEFERTLNMLAQRVRNLGIHLIIATQRPSARIVTGSIKANFPCRISFKLASHTDSQTILDESGAEDLLGKGDMILKTEDKQVRLQGTFISENALSDFVTSYIIKYSKRN